MATIERWWCRWLKILRIRKITKRTQQNKQKAEKLCAQELFEERERFLVQGKEINR